MSFLDPAELADIRTDIASLMTDTAYILRAADQAALTAAGGAQGGLSNGAGGIRQTVAPVPAPPAPEPQFDQVGGAVPCRLSSFSRGLGEVLAEGVAQGRTMYRVKLPYSVSINATDRLRIVTDTDDFVYEVIAIEPRTDQFSRSIRVFRIE